ncbi:MAG: hypothetical protein SCK70_10145 [bacterium]|nr:hypothetical protein [bacterium]
MCREFSGWDFFLSKPGLVVPIHLSLKMTGVIGMWDNYSLR